MKEQRWRRLWRLVEVGGGFLVRYPPRTRRQRPETSTTSINLHHPPSGLASAHQPANLMGFYG